MTKPPAPDDAAAHETQTSAFGREGPMLTLEDMVRRGAYGFLTRGVERCIPLDKITPVNVSPACPGWGAYTRIAGPERVEVKYSAEEDVYLLFAGLGAVESARRRGDRTIDAFVEPDAGRTE